MKHACVNRQVALPSLRRWLVTEEKAAAHCSCGSLLFNKPQQVAELCGFLHITSARGACGSWVP